MGNSYTRQETYTDGDVITAAHTNNEFDQIKDAFAASTGHTHDGTEGEGGPIAALAVNAITLGAGTTGQDVVVTFDGESSDGVLKWMEDEEYFEFSNDVLLATTKKLQFRDTAIYINSSTDGQLDLIADGAVLIDTAGDITLDADGGDIFFKDAGTTFGSATNTSGNLIIKSGTTTALTFSGANATFAGTIASGAIDTAAANITSGGVIKIDVDSDADDLTGDSATGRLTIGAGEDLNLYHGGTNSYIVNDTGDLIIDTAGDIVLDADGANIIFKDSGTSIPDIANNSTDVELTVSTADKNFLIKGTDGSSAITALDIDMALAGKATFNGDVVVGGDLTITGDDLVMGTNTDGHILIADGSNFNPVAISSLTEISSVAAADTFLAIDADGGTGLKRIRRDTLVAGLATSNAITSVAADDTPQLGGDLDMNGNDIVTTSNATLDLAPNGTGTVVVRGNTNSGRIVFNCESNSHGQTVYAQPHSAAVTNTLMLPAGANSTLVSLVSTDTLTNKTLTSPKINEDVAVTATATELNTLDGITAVVGELNALDLGSTAVGTAIASKAVILDSNKDYTGIRNFTVSGELDAATGDFSGDVDIDGTLEADAITVNGTALATVIAGTTVTTATNANHVSVADNENTNEENLIPFIEDASATGNVGLESDGDFAYNPSTGTVSATVFKGNIDAVDGDFDGTLEADAITIGGTAIASVLSPVAGSSSIVTTGALNSGSITSGFGTINTGSSAITTTGVITGGTLEATTDTSSGDNAAIGYTSGEGLILTGQGTTTDVTIKNDNDATVASIATGTTIFTLNDDVFVTGRASGTATTNTNGQMDLETSNHFNYTPSGDDEIELDNFKGGQTGTIFLDNSGGHQISVDSTIIINADVLSALATAGKYMLSYYCTVDQPNATLSNSANNDKILMSATGALT